MVALNMRWVSFVLLRSQPTRRIRARSCRCRDLSLMTCFFLATASLSKLYFILFLSWRSRLSGCLPGNDVRLRWRTLVRVQYTGVFARHCCRVIVTRKAFQLMFQIWSCEWSASTRQLLKLRHSWKVSFQRRKEAFQLCYCLPAVVVFTALQLLLPW